MSMENPILENGDFDFDEPNTSLLSHEAPNMFQLDIEDDNSTHPPQALRSPHLSFLNVFALIVGMIIGSGIFATPSRVDSNVPSPGVAIIVWVVAGVVAWAGATSFAELGAAIPRNGGMQEYLGYIYGDFLASIMSWTWVIVIKPSSMAIISIVFADYWTSILNPSSSKPVMLVKLLALITVGGMLLINCVSVRSSTGLTNILLYSKLSTVALIIFLAIPALQFSSSDGVNQPVPDWKSKNWFGNRRKDEDGSSVEWSSLSSWDLLGHLTTALYAALWACGGWDNVNVIVAEIRDPIRDLPRAVYAAIPTVTICFVLVNLAYYIILPWEVVQDSDAIAVAVGKQTLGTTGGLIFAILVSASCLGVLNIDIYTTGILTVTSARRGYLPKFLAGPSEDDLSSQSTQNPQIAQSVGTIGQIQKIVFKLFKLNRSKSPIRAMTFNALTACPYIIFGTFGPLVTMSGIAGYVFLFLTVCGVLILRVRQPLLKPAQQLLEVVDLSAGSRINLGTSYVGLSSKVFQSSLASLFFDPLQSLILLHSSSGKYLNNWLNLQDLESRSSATSNPTQTQLDLSSPQTFTFPPPPAQALDLHKNLVTGNGIRSANMQSTNRSSKAVGFFDLPKELRDRIYTFILDSKIKPIRPSRDAIKAYNQIRAAERAYAIQPHDIASFGLLYACRQSRYEMSHAIARQCGTEEDITYELDCLVYRGSIIPTWTALPAPPCHLRHMVVKIRGSDCTNGPLLAPCLLQLVTQFFERDYTWWGQYCNIPLIVDNLTIHIPSSDDTACAKFLKELASVGSLWKKVRRVRLASRTQNMVWVVIPSWNRRV
ncbi:hypothetical protein MMC07_001467 [Pseudocyphellaria aurata]|nr:hypothetical protein [Pseudocyphellaria aurata]